MDRKYNIKLDLKFRCNNSNMKFMQYDNNTSDFCIKITNEGEKVDLKGAIVTLATIKPSGKTEAQFLEVKDNTIYADLAPSMKDEIGDYMCRACIVLDNKAVYTDVVNYTVEEDKIFTSLNNEIKEDDRFNLLNDMLQRLSTVEQEEQQREINETQRILNEEQKKQAELLRVENELKREHEEADRTQYEASRNTNEEQRKQSELLRVEAEQQRVLSEKARLENEKIRMSNEEDRIKNYDFMTEDEQRRRTEEDTRIANEKARIANEDNRVNEENRRRTVESSRVRAEGTRQSNEVTRQSNEVTRQSNEQTRVSEEAKRVERFNTFITDAESKSQDFNSYIIQAKQDEEQRKENEKVRVSSEETRVGNENKRIVAEVERANNERERIETFNENKEIIEGKILEVDNKLSEKTKEVNTAIDKSENKIKDVEKRFNNLTAQQQQDAEVIDARDGEDSLSARLERDLKIEEKPLKDFVIDMNNLKEIQDLEYKTDKGYLVCENTQNGSVKDFKIKGKTLVNLCPQQQINFKEYSVVRIKIGKLKNNSTIIPCELPNGVQWSLNNGAYATRYTDSTEPMLLKDNKDYENIDLCLRPNNGKVDGGEYPINFVCKFMILEGDYTQNPPTYFEGIKSVENESGIEVISRNKKILDESVEVSEGQLLKEDRKIILFKDNDDIWKPITELKGIDENICDTIEKGNDGKYYLHIKTDKKVLNGSEEDTFTLNNSDAPSNSDLLRFDLSIRYGNTKIICDKLNVLDVLGNGDTEGIKANTNKNLISIFILKSKLSTEDVEGFKTWLKTNPITLIYQLEEEKVCEVNPLDLESYDNETMVLVEGGAIVPYLEFKITSSLPSVVRNIQNRVSRLEKDLYVSNMANFTVALNMLETKLKIENFEKAPLQK